MRPISYSLTDLNASGQKDGWALNSIYIITFGGFLGLATFLPSFFYSQFHVTKIQAGSLTVLATLTDSLTRVFGGWLADRIGGITTLSIVLLAAITNLSKPNIHPLSRSTTILFMLCFAALGAGNGATFQLVPLRWTYATAVAGSMIGEIGALGDGILPNLLGQAKQRTGSYGIGFIAALAFSVLGMLRIISHRWTHTWVEAGGRSLIRTSEAPPPEENCHAWLPESLRKNLRSPGF